MMKSALKKSLFAALAVTTAAVPVSALMAQNANTNTRCNPVMPSASKVGSGPTVYRYPQSHKFRKITSPRARRNIRVAPSAVPAWRSARQPVRQPVVRTSRQPTRQPVAQTPLRPVDMGPSSGAIGSPIRLRINQNLGAAPALLSFKAVVTRGVPARVHVRLSGRGSNYAIQAPIQLCIQGGGTWQAELVLSNGRNIGVIGSFTPTNCPR